MRPPQLLAALLAIATVTACVQPATPPQAAKLRALGTLELSFDVSANGQLVTVRPQAVFADNAISGLTRVIANATDDGTTRYINASFEFSNASPAAFSNLSFYAYNQAANNAGGTAIKNLTNFGGSSVAVSAQRLRPTHAMTATSAGVAAIIAGREDLQVFSATEAAAAETAATPSILSPADTVLEYGFTARGIDGTGAPTGARAIAVGAKGRVSPAFKLPSGSVTGAPYSFVATFLIADELNTRLTRSPEETTAQVAARAGTGNEVVLVGSDADTVTTPAVQNIRLPNARISTTPALLLEPSCDPAATPLTATISALQGTGATAALSGVQTVDGVIVADFQATGTLPTERKLGGFYLQDRFGDGDAASSDAVFVFEGSGVPTKRNVGDFVRVTGTPAEFNGGTQLTAPTVIACGTRELPAPVVVTLPVTSQANLERFEGMRVTVPQTLTVTETFALGRYGLLSLSSGGRLFQPTNITAPGSSANAQQALNNAHRILLDDGLTLQNPSPLPFLDSNATPGNSSDDFRRIGDTVTGFTGVLAQSCASATCGTGVDVVAYRLLPSQNIPWVNANPRSVTPDSVSSSGVPSPLRVVSTNVLNYFTTLNAGGATFTPSGGGCTNTQTPRGANSSAEFTRQRGKIIAGLVALNADVVGLIEMQNNGSGAGSAVRDLVDGLNAALGANTYAIVDDSGIIVGCDAIKMAMIYKPARVSLKGTAVSDSNAVFSRPPVAQAFGFNGGTFTLVMNHFKSKGGCPTGGGADSDLGDGQSCWNDLRKSQATQLKAFIETLKARTSPIDTDILTMGDFNAYLNENPMTIFETDPNPLSNLIRSVPEAGRYSYVFDGQSGNLDHALASTSLAAQVSGVTEVHYNSDEPISFDYNLEFKNNPACASGTPPGSSCFGQDVFDAATPFRYSDHDPILVGLGLTADSTVVAGGPVNPSVNLSLSSNTSAEATPNNTVTITATASSAVTGAQTVGVTVTGAGITATDYSLSSPTITITDGQTTGFVTLTVLDDADLEGTETATVTLVSPSSGIVLGTPISGNLAITDNEVAPVAAVVISQVYGGGGNTSAPLRNDFIELKNNSSSAVSVSGWSVQYTSAAGTTWAVTALTGSIAPGGYYLVQQAAGTATPPAPALPTPDATGTLAMAGAAGKVALVNTTTALTGSSSVGASIVDFVGYGTATTFEGTGPTPAPSNTTAAIRKGSGCTDTNVNSSDFTALAPTPRNSSTTAVTCP